MPTKTAGSILLQVIRNMTVIQLQMNIFVICRKALTFSCHTIISLMITPIIRQNSRGDAQQISCFQTGLIIVFISLPHSISKNLISATGSGRQEYKNKYGHSFSRSVRFYFVLFSLTYKLFINQCVNKSTIFYIFLTENLAFQSDFTY